MDSLTLKIRYKDRLGLVMDVSTVLSAHGLNIEALQLMTPLMYVEIRNRPHKPWSSVLSELENVPHILSVERIKDMPFRIREKQMTTIMNSMSTLDAAADPFEGIIGDSPAMRTVIAQTKRIAISDSTVMLRGESGTGKELFAKAIHYASERRDKVFVPLNCGAIPENLLESELFGYREGAFSGAKKGGRVGLFQFANGGTIFLDEISDLPMPLQVKLLRVLQEGYVRPLGDNEEISVNTRIITATNRDVEELVAEGRFREDLYYRLNVIPIRLPPLRQRKEDIPALAAYCLRKRWKQGSEAKHFTPAAIERMEAHSWPGNVREFENVVNRALHLSEGNAIEADDIVFDGSFNRAAFYDLRKTESDNAPQLKHAAHRAERDLIRSALQDYGSLRAAAKALGVSHTTVANKAKQFGIIVK